MMLLLTGMIERNDDACTFNYFTMTTSLTQYNESGTETGRCYAVYVLGDAGRAYAVYVLGDAGRAYAVLGRCTATDNDFYLLLKGNLEKICNE